VGWPASSDTSARECSLSLSFYSVSQKEMEAGTMDVFIVLVCIKQSSPLFGKLQFQGYCRHLKSRFDL
jgi:hypothetical protein